MENSKIEFTVRRLRKEDAAVIAKHANNKKIWDNMADRFPHPFTEERAHEWVKRMLDNPNPQNHFVIDVNGEAVGGLRVFVKEDVHRKNAETGYWLSEEYWGKGIMTGAIKQAVKFAFEKLDVVRIQASVYSKNLGSMKVLEKSGFKEEAVLKKAIFKNDEFCDEHIFSILKEDYVKKSEDCKSID